MGECWGLAYAAFWLSGGAIGVTFLICQYLAGKDIRATRAKQPSSTGEGS